MITIIDAHAAMLQATECLQHDGAPGTLWRPYPSDKLRRIVLDGRHFHANPCPIAGNGVERLRDARPAGELPKVYCSSKALRVAGLAQELLGALGIVGRNPVAEVGTPAKRARAIERISG